MTFFECYADEALLRFFGFSSKQLSGGHSFGRSNVSRKLRKVADSIGVVDEDPGAAQDDYLKYLMTLPPIHKDSYLISSKDSKANNILVVMRPNLEAWAIKLAHERGIDLSNAKYGLSMDVSKLHEILMLQKNSKKRYKFIEFISDISDHKAIVKLKELLKK